MPRPGRNSSARARHSNTETDMTLESIKTALPDYARDLKLNLSSLMSDPALSSDQRLGALLAAAITAGEPTVIAAAEAEAAALPPETREAARSAAAIMA